MRVYPIDIEVDIEADIPASGNTGILNNVGEYHTNADIQDADINADIQKENTA